MGQELTTMLKPEVTQAGSDIAATHPLSLDIVMSQYLSAWAQKQWSVFWLGKEACVTK